MRHSLARYGWVTSAGLFAWSFMDDTNLSASESLFQFTKEAVLRYGRAAR
jgi:hypothetical protein